MSLLKKIGSWFLVFWLLAIWAYSNAIGCQFTDDFFAFVWRFEEHGWQGFWKGYDFHSLYYFNNLVFFGTYSLFGYGVWAWYLLFTGLHALNASLAFAFIRKLFAQNKLPLPFLAPLAMALLFLLSPYQTENLVWGGTLNYLLCLCCFWIGALLYGSYLQRGGIWLLAAFYGVYVLALFSLGMALVFPAIFLAVFCFMWPARQSIGGHAVRIALPMAVAIGLLFWLNYAVKGSFITHYGTDMHTSFSVSKIVVTAWQYMAKLLAYVHFWPGNWRVVIYEKLQSPLAYSGLTAVAIAILALAFWLNRERGRFLFGWVLALLFALLPVLNMYFMYWHAGENDRLSYAASIFVFGLPVLLLAYWGKVKVLMAYVAMVLGLNIVLLGPQVDKWKHSTAIQTQALDSPYFDGPGNIYLLNLPNYYQGVYIYRSTTYLQWKRSYQYGLPDVSHMFKVVASANMGSPTDSASVEVLGPNRFKVELSAWGNWFWWGRPDSTFSVAADEWNHSYVLEIPHLQPEDKLLYFAPGGWKPVIRTLNPSTNESAP